MNEMLHKLRVISYKPAKIGAISVIKKSRRTKKICLDGKAE